MFLTTILVEAEASEYESESDSNPEELEDLLQCNMFSN